MTPKQWTQKAFDQAEFMIDVDAAREAIADAIRAAVAEEREACAKLADELEAIYEISEPIQGMPGRVIAHHDFADAIRART